LRRYEHAGDLAAGPYLLLGTREAAHASLPARSSRPRHWLLLTDATGYSAELAQSLRGRMQEHGDRISSAVASDAAALGSALDDSAKLGGPLHGVVYLSGLNRLRAGGGEALLEAQVARCAGLAELA